MVLIPEYEQFYGDVLNGNWKPPNWSSMTGLRFGSLTSWRQWMNLAKELAHPDQRGNVRHPRT